jgi:heme A synthase
LKSDLTAYNPRFHGFAVFTACACFVLVIAGALVTSNDAGLSVPDWPTSGFAASLTRAVWGVGELQPEFSVVVVTVSQVAVGVLLLATTVVLAVEVLRHTARTHPEEVGVKSAIPA